MQTTGKVVVIAGATASGKTLLTHALALLYKAPVISADSRQVFKELHIGTAQPEAKLRDELPYFFVDSLPPTARFTAMDFAAEALILLNTLTKKHPVVFITGGSGLYLDALLYPKHQLPDKDEAYRARMNEQLAEGGLGLLSKMLQEQDPETAQKTDLQNPRRVMRALEILHLMGNKKPEMLPPFPYPFIYLGLDPGRETLYENIHVRVEQMLARGLVEEVRNLLAYRDCQALQTVGYKEILDYLDGRLSLPEAVDKIKQHTRNYAKRQMTWFKKNREIQWFHPEQFDDIKTVVSAFAGKDGMNT
ncbi:MAG: tRNA (adenosine(37)-N6)-dimethylallyltransferase MiaA [Bacteroidota bacterium]|jgi:tRNA dimethylallyltransferase